jgi:cellulose synthase/poly-beta-1,6-N-acetylglucosamine synthase-like glycosyltransferase
MDLVNIILSVVYLITLFYTIFWLITFLGSEEERKKEPKHNPLVSVIVPAYNEEKSIRETLSSIVKLDYPKEKLDIIVVNDGSEDSTEEVVKGFISENRDYNIKIINQENQGKWVAMNNALNIAKGEFFACLDADSVVSKDALKKMIPYFDDGNVAIVLPLIKVKNPRNMLQRFQHYEYIVNFFYKKIMGYLNCIHVSPGPFSIYRKSILEKLGGFREGHNTEDLEIALRVQKNNYKIIQLMNAEVYTYLPDNFKELYYQRNRWNKGALLNAWDYRKIIFNRKYGDFGMIQMPVVICSGFLAMAIMLLLLYYNIVKPFASSFHNLSLVNFDIFSFIANMNFSINILDFNYYKIIIMLVILSVTVMIITFAHKYTHERMMKFGLFSLVSYMFLYYLFLGFVWIGVTKDLVLKKAKKW